MKSSARNIQLTSYDDLFTPGEKQEKARENVQEIEYGILVPGLARPGPDGGYELVAGHRRKRASELAGKTVMPVIVREMDEEEAVLAMVDSNLQRENILPSEKAWAYKMKLDAIRRRADHRQIILDKLARITVWKSLVKIPVTVPETFTDISV